MILSERVYQEMRVTLHRQQIAGWIAGLTGETTAEIFDRARAYDREHGVGLTAALMTDYEQRMTKIQEATRA